MIIVMNDVNRYALLNKVTWLSKLLVINFTIIYLKVGFEIIGSEFNFPESEFKYIFSKHYFFIFFKLCQISQIITYIFSLIYIYKFIITPMSEFIIFMIKL